MESQNLAPRRAPIASSRVSHRTVGLLGLLTICAYGSWFYSFGVLLDPIIVDTGWRESMLAASFSAGQVITGVTALAGGRLLDRAGHRVVFLLGATLSFAGLFTASVATSPAVFFAGATLGLGATGTLGFYHVTMPTAVRLNADGARAITVLTYWGAFASVIFLPGTSWLLTVLDWRTTARLLAVTCAGAFALAAFLLPPGERGSNNEPTPIRSIVGGLVDRPSRRLFTAAVAFGGIALATMLVYQVPAMTSLGLSAATASSIAAARGACQLLGRLPLTPIVTRLGIDGGLALAFFAVASAGFLLAVSSTVLIGAVFAVVAGFGLGAFSPLQGMKTEALFERGDLGSTMGLYGSVLLLTGSVGPVATGLLVDATGDRRWAAAIVAASGLGAMACIAAMVRGTRAPERPRASVG